MVASIFSSQQSAFRGGVVAPISPSTLLSGGVMGAWYDPTDTSTMFQDTGGTTPVTAVGQTCARINAKSGTFAPLLQATVSLQPLVSQTAGGLYRLTFDAVDDALSTAAAQVMSQTDECTVFVAANFNSSTNAPALWAHGGSTANGSITLSRGVPNAGSFSAVSRGTIAATATASPYLGSLSRVITGRAKISTDIVEIFIDGALIGSSGGDQGTGGYSSRAPTIGRQFAAGLDAHISGIFVTNRYLTNSQIAGVTAFLKARM